MSFSTPGSREHNDRSDMSTNTEYSRRPSERLGVLSITLAPSPAIRWILPARIRSSQQNDVVIVGNTYIQLREFNEHGHLSDATAKLDFGMQIAAAKVISAKAVTVQVHNVIPDQPWDEHQFYIKGVPCAEDQPPQIVVLYTSTNELVFVYARTSYIDSQVKFVWAKRALLRDVTLSKPGAVHMAVDLECKIMATVASSNVFTVFSLKEVDELKANIDTWDSKKPQSFQPYFEQRMIQVDGDILRMDFLRPSKNAPHKALLLLIVSNNDRSFLLLYQWNTRQPLDQIQPFSKVMYDLPPEDRFPMFLIPLHARHASFAIVTETQVVYYDDVVRGQNTKRVSDDSPLKTQDGKPATWAAWARLVRHQSHADKNDDILLIRDDGWLETFTRPIEPESSWPPIYTPGKIHVGVDTAVCLLPGRHMSGDILIVGGSMIDGGVYHLPPRKELFMLQIIPDVSPVHSMSVLESRSAGAEDARSQRCFVTAGKSENSSLNELRFGLEAQIGWTVPSSLGETVNRIWSFEHAASHKLYILASHLEHTTALALDLITEKIDELDPSNFSGLQLDDCTLAAEILTSGVTVQITSSLIVTSFEKPAPTVSRIKGCVCAEINCNNGTFAIVCKVGPECQIRVGLIHTIDEHQSIILSPSVYSTSDRPLCLSLFEITDIQYLSVGYLDGRIEVLSIDEDGGLKLEATSKGYDSSSFPITSLLTLSYPGSFRALLVAGTRDGKLLLFNLTFQGFSDGHLSLDCQLERTFQVGATTVSVTSATCHNNDNLSALVMCGTRLDRISYFNSNTSSDYVLSNIWLSTRNDLVYNHPTFTAARRTRHMQSIRGKYSDGYLICATKDDLLFCTLVEQEQMIPRRLTLDGNGARYAAYSTVLKKFIVICDSSTRSIANSGNLDDSQTTSALYLVDPDNTVDDNERDIKVILGDHETVTALTTFQPNNGKSHYDFVMLGLSDGTNSRLGFITIKRLLDNPEEVTFKQCQMFWGRKIHALCEFEETFLIVGIGCEIQLLRLDFSKRVWAVEAAFDLPSEPLSLSTLGSIIYIATARHSTLCLNWNGTDTKFEEVFFDHVARNTRTIVPFGQNGDHALVASVSGEGTSILGYSVGHNRSNSTPLFEARMPLNVSHIAPISTSWSSSPSQAAFQAVSLDGTTYTFQTITSSEHKLLRFVEQLAQPDPFKPARRPMALLTGRMAKHYIRSSIKEGAPYFDPKRLHVRGDIIKRLVDEGPEHLKNLVGNKIKKEDEMDVDEGKNATMMKLENLARPLVGEVDDVSAAVVAWCRKMLRATIF